MSMVGTFCPEDKAHVLMLLNRNLDLRCSTYLILRSNFILVIKLPEVT